MAENTLANELVNKPVNSLIAPLQRMFRQLHEERGIIIDGAALTLAYDGMAGDLYILNVSMPDGKSCADKTECVIRALHQYIKPQDRNGLTGVRVFDSLDQFKQFVKWGIVTDCEPCEASMPLEQRLRLKPKEFAVEAY